MCRFPAAIKSVLFGQQSQKMKWCGFKPTWQWHSCTVVQPVWGALYWNDLPLNSIQPYVLTIDCLGLDVELASCSWYRLLFSIIVFCCACSNASRNKKDIDTEESTKSDVEFNWYSRHSAAIQRSQIPELRLMKHVWQHELMPIFTIGVKQQRRSPQSIADNWILILLKLHCNSSSLCMICETNQCQMKLCLKNRISVDLHQPWWWTDGIHTHPQGTQTDENRKRTSKNLKGMHDFYIFLIFYLSIYLST